MDTIEIVGTKVFHVEGGSELYLRTKYQMKLKVGYLGIDIVGRQVFCADGGSEQCFGTKYETK